jgi:hypothetical protein
MLLRRVVPVDLHQTGGWLVGHETLDGVEADIFEEFARLRGSRGCNGQ